MRHNLAVPQLSRVSTLQISLGRKHRKVVDVLALADAIHVVYLLITSWGVFCLQPLKDVAACLLLLNRG